MDSQESGNKPPTMRAARDTALEFLQDSLTDVRRTDVMRITRNDAAASQWEVEVQVWQPNATIRALNLETERPVLDTELYLVRLDEQLNVIAYGIKELLQDG